MGEEIRALDDAGALERPARLQPRLERRVLFLGCGLIVAGRFGQEEPHLTGVSLPEREVLASAHRKVSDGRNFLNPNRRKTLVREGRVAHALDESKRQCRAVT